MPGFPRDVLLLGIPHPKCMQLAIVNTDTSLTNNSDLFSFLYQEIRQ